MIDETVEEIAEMRTHSSSIVAINATQALSELLEREYATVEEFVQDVEHNSRALRRANTSHASLHTTQREVVRAVTETEVESVQEAKRVLESAIARVVNDVETGKRRAAMHLSERLEDGMTLLTHDYSTTVLEGIELATREGNRLSVYVTEARPRYLGRKSARALATVDGVDATLVVDGASGHVLRECDAVAVGMDCVVDGTLYNRVGTYPIAAVAKDLGVPVWAAGSDAKVVDRGFAFENAHRSPSEVMLEPADGFSIENPAYDATPLRLLDAVLTDEGPRGVD
jgi:translation initiation factor 2B subunit (eIF-2B alpha/beta/delta family)